MARSPWLFAAPFLLILPLACAPDDGEGDGGPVQPPRRDAGAGLEDGGASEDGGVTADAGSAQEDAGAPGPDAGVEPEAACTPDATLIAAGRACRSDDSCPCGSHCALGQCVAACAVDDDCGDGERCDRFGRCRANVSTTLLPPAPEEAPARVVPVDRVVLAAPGETAWIRFNLDAPADEPVKVRLAAREETMTFACDGEPTTGSCLLSVEPTAARYDVDVAVEVTRAADAPDRLSFVDVFVEGGAAETVTLQSPALAGFAQAPPLAGVYRGVAELVGAGVGAPDAPVAAREPVGFALRAEVFDAGDGLTIAIEDPTGGLSPSGSLVGTLDPDSGTASFPSYVVAAGEALAGQPYELIAEVPDAPLRLADGEIALDLELRVRGLTEKARAVRLSYLVLLERAGASSGALPPAVPADVTPSLDGDRPSTTATSWTRPRATG